MIALDNQTDSGKTMISIYQDRLRKDEDLDQTDFYDLLKTYEDCLESLAYLASCNAATLESLPKSASNSVRNRAEVLNRKSAEALRRQYFALRSCCTAKDRTR